MDEGNDDQFDLEERDDADGLLEEEDDNGQDEGLSDGHEEVDRRPDPNHHEDEQPLSQDPDFQSQERVVVLPKLTGRNSVPEPRPKNVETEECVCSICFEPWTNSGLHRLVSLKCGHLFGENCILKWIHRGGQVGQTKCPECNVAAARKDIRRIWSKSISVVDTAERDKARADAKTEHDMRMRMEQELKQSRMAYEMLKSETTKLQQKHDRQRALKQRYILYQGHFCPLFTIPAKPNQEYYAFYLEDTALKSSNFSFQIQTIAFNDNLHTRQPKQSCSRTRYTDSKRKKLLKK